MAALTLAALAAMSTLLGFARFAGPAVRRAAQIASPAPMPETLPTFSDMPSGGVFFENRDSVRVTVPRTMSVADFLSLYHLENNGSARQALERQLGAAELDDVLEKGQQLSIRLTSARSAPSGGQP